MALQDLTPQLRTRLSRMEKAVGWFVMLAIVLLAFGFVYYVYNTAQRKGWFKSKAPYFTFTDRATGLRVGDPVQMMGFDVGEITRIDAQPPDDFYFNVYVEFEIQAPYYGYLWTDGSRAKVATADFLGKRVLEVTKGTGGYPTYVFHPLRTVTLAEARALPELGRWLVGEEVVSSEDNEVLAKAKTPLSEAILTALQAAGHESVVVMDGREERKSITGIWDDKDGRYLPFTRTTKPYWLLSDESPAVTERLEQLVGQVEAALPNILALTNSLGAVLANSANATSNLNVLIAGAQPAVSNVALATAQLNHPGALGEWLWSTNLPQQLEETLSSARSLMSTAETTASGANTNMAVLVENLGRSLDNLAGITSHLNQQVQANTNILRAVSDAVIHADELVQGLKQHWLLRSAFRDRGTNVPPALSQDALRSPKDAGRP